jgi:sialidase-1
LPFLASFWGWSVLQGDFDFENIESDPIHLFVGDQDSYTIYRIPGLIVIPQGAQLADRHTLKDDLVLALAEARRNGSLDDGDIDMVVKRSIDNGQS